MIATLLNVTQANARVILRVSGPIFLTKREMARTISARSASLLQDGLSRSLRKE